MVAILGERSTQPDIAHLVEKVKQSVQALEGMFTALLDVSRLDAGAVRPAILDFRVSNLLALVESNFRPLATARGIDFRIVPCSVVVRSDPALLERVVGNFVANAIRYTSTGRVLLGCRRSQSSVRILVLDTGPGIPAGLHEQIFEEFFQVPRTHLGAPQGAGLGLGLSIAKRTAEILGHRLLLESRLNQGSSFGVEVPIVREQTASTVAETDDETPWADVSGMFILIIDDDPETCFATEALFSGWGCHVVSGNSPDVVLENLRLHLRTPDLILADYQLANGMTGVGALQRVRRHLEDTIPAILMTGDLTIRQTHLAYVDRVTLLYKPVNAESLRRAVAELWAGAVPGGPHDLGLTGELQSELARDDNGLSASSNIKGS